MFGGGGGRSQPRQHDSWLLGCQVCDDGWYGFSAWHAKYGEVEGGGGETAEYRTRRDVITEKGCFKCHH